MLWHKTFNWSGLTLVVPRDRIFAPTKSPEQGLLQTFCFGNADGKRHAVMWSIWRARNDSIFSSKVVGIDEVFEGIMMIAWKWLTAKKKGRVCNFYEWKTCPIDCIIG
jgi:hypothetical protein